MEKDPPSLPRLGMTTSQPITGQQEQAINFGGTLGLPMASVPPSTPTSRLLKACSPDNHSEEINAAILSLEDGICSYNVEAVETALKSPFLDNQALGDAVSIIFDRINGGYKQPQSDQERARRNQILFLLLSDERLTPYSVLATFRDAIHCGIFPVVEAILKTGQLDKCDLAQGIKDAEHRVSFENCYPRQALCAAITDAYKHASTLVSSLPKNRVPTEACP